MRYAIFLLVLLLSLAGNAWAGSTPKEWEFETPGGNLIGTNDIFAHQGVVIYDTTYRPFVPYIKSARFFDGYIAGDAVEGPFLFNEKNQKVERFPGMPDLKKAIEERQLIALKREELDDYFNLGSSLRPLVVLLYMPCIFAVMMLQLREYPVRQRTKIAGFMVVEGAVVSAAALWLVLGLAGLFLTFKFGGYNFHLNTVVNLATMVFSLFLIWTMLYLNEEVTQHRHQTLVNAARFISFVCFTIFIYWMASVLLEPSLPPDYWQGQF